MYPQTPGAVQPGYAVAREPGSRMPTGGRTNPEAVDWRDGRGINTGRMLLAGAD
jgi:hypothetical protein